MSKSKGNVIYADDLVEKYGVDAVRFYMIHEMPYASDGSITYENIINRYNTDLANNLGNLVSRTHAMTVKYFDGVIPAPTANGEFDEELIVFDLETTGLSPMSCKITEIGAVKIKDGKVLDRFNTFVDPEVPIPEEIVELTGITDEMVKGAPKVKEALTDFFAFIGNDRVPEGRPKPLLIAHNANFDIGFIRHFAKISDLPFDNPYLDTVALSRHIHPELNKHKLDTLAEHYHLGDFNHHRACDDAEMLARIYFCMIDTMQKLELHDLQDLHREMIEKADPLKLNTYHQIILVKNAVGLKNLYKLISYSYLDYFKRFPRIPKTVLEKHREGLIIGSACEAGELFKAVVDHKDWAELKRIASYYDFLEIQPLSNNMFMLAKGLAKDVEELKEFNRTVIQLGKELGKSECKHFADGECSISVYEPVRGSDVFIVQSTCKPVNDNLMEMLIMIDAFKRASAARITAVIPYMGYARQDRKAKARDPISAKLVADLITSAGADRVLTMDLHASQIQGYFDIPVDHMLGMPIYRNYFKEQNIEDLVIVSPDHGSVPRARKMAEKRICGYLPALQRQR